MAKKRDKIARRRQVARARRGTQRSERTRPSGPPPSKKEEERKRRMMDLWIAVGIVVLVVGALAGAYIWSQRPAPATDVATATPSAEEGTMTPDAEPALSWSEPPAMALEPDVDYQAIIRTEKGDIRIDLYQDRAPLTVNNFVFLARQGYYDGVTFHRVLPGFMAQTGDPTGTGSGGPGYTFADEFSPELRHDGAGVVSMANAGANTNGSQFFITYAPQPHLDDQHSVFGGVLEGMDVLESLTPRNPLENPDAPPGDRILTIEIVEQ